MTSSHCWFWASAIAALTALPAQAQSRCPNAAAIPQLTIDRVQDPAVPLIDAWQVLLRDVALSDAQLAALAKDDVLIDRTREEMTNRGTWVYVGLAGAAVGAVASAVGWFLYGEASNNIPETVALSMGLGGFIVSGAGLLLVTDSIQRPLEPHLAPTPRHRLTREEARALVAVINDRFYEEICAAAEDAQPDGSAATRPVVEQGPARPAVPVGADSPAKAK